jgi:hypothetical protein
MSRSTGTAKSERLELSSLNSKGLDALHAEVARAFDFFNALHWGGALPVPIFAFFRQPPNGHRLGHYRARSWKAPDGELRDELIFYADLALERGMHEVLVTLLHEAVHVWQEHFGRPSVAHHNEEWHREAARVGLVTSGASGATDAGAAFLAAVEEFKPRVDKIPFRVRELAGRKPGKQVKWTCGCGFGVRVAIANFDASCNRCGRPFCRADGRR